MNKKWVLLLIIGFTIALLNACVTKPVSLELTVDEQHWLEDHPVIYYGSDPEFAPYEYLDGNQKHVGIAADYVQKVEAILGVDFVLKPTVTWTEALEMGMRNEVNLLFMAKTSERLEYFDFTEPVVQAPNVFIVNSTKRSSLDLKNISQYKVGVQKSYSNKEYLLLLYPQSDTVDYETIVSGLQDLSAGKIDAFLADLGQTTYYINKYNIPNLLILDALEYDFELSFAVNKDYAPLMPILDKAIATISQIDRETIMERWYSSTYKSWLNRDRLKLLYIISITVTLVALFFFMTSLILRKIVHDKTKALVETNNALETRVLERTKALEDSMAQLVQAEKYASLGHVVSSVAHELNTPLGNLIISQSYGLKKLELVDTAYKSNTLSKRGLEESIQEIRDLFLSSIKTLEFIVSTIDRFKRLEATLISDYVGTIDIKEAIVKSIHLMRARDVIPDTVDVEMTLQPYKYDGNLVWVEEIVENLVLNSLVHNNYKCEKISIDMYKTDTLNIRFRDYGVGIPPELLPHIFEPFVKNNERAQLSGLGLSIVYNIVYRNLHGSIEVESVPNVHTDFIIKLPL